MKITAVLLVLLAVLIGVVPMFTDCHSQGRMLTLENGNHVDMKCHWTARAELGMALPMALVGIVTGISKRRETRRMLGIAGIGLGALAILLPTALIGVCSNPEMICNSIMRPTLILLGTLVIGLSAWVLFRPGADPAALPLQ
jgi:hypothetical protein